MSKKAEGAEKLASEKANKARLAAKPGETLSKVDSERFVQQASTALVWQKGMYLWAAKINGYRKSAATFLYGPVITIFLLIFTTFLFGLTNFWYLQVSEQPVYGFRIFS